MQASRFGRVARSAVLVAVSTFAGAFAVGCGAEVTTHTATNPSASFASYRTFSFGPIEGPPNGYRMSAQPSDGLRRLQGVISAALQQRGYLPATDAKADVYVVYGAGRRTVVEHANSSVAGEWLPDDENADFVEGSIVIDVFDGATSKRVWHGVSATRVDLGRISDSVLKTSVSDLLASFPKGAASAS
jgi:hypothetical protein